MIYRGPPSPVLLFVGEAPGRDEDRMGLPFVGPAGRILARAIEALSLEPWEFGITNVVMCRPPGNRFLPEAAGACAPWLQEKIHRLRPRGLITLGSHALEAFRPDALPITSAAGRLWGWGGLPLFPLLHPAALLHGPRYRARWEEDLRSLRSVLPDLRAGRIPPGETAPGPVPGTTGGPFAKTLLQGGDVPSP